MAKRKKSALEKIRAVVCGDKAPKRKAPEKKKKKKAKRKMSDETKAKMKANREAKKARQAATMSPADEYREQERYEATQGVDGLKRKRRR